MVRSEVYGTKVIKTDIWMENFRRSIELKIKETKEVYESEVTELKTVEKKEAKGYINIKHKFSHYIKNNSFLNFIAIIIIS